MIGFAGAQWVPSPNYGGLGDASRKSWIIIHGTAGYQRASQCAAEFADPASQVSAHYIVGRNGTIIQCVSEDQAAWSNGGVTGTPRIGGVGLPVYGDGIYRDPWWSPDPMFNPNRFTISIEHIKPHTDNSDSLTDAQKQASFALIYDICQRWKIPMRAADAAGGITGHFSMDPVNRSHCPGPYPWNELWAFLTEKEAPVLTIEGAKDYFDASPDGVYWTCKQTKFVIGHGILNFYKSYGGSALCGLTYLGLPLSNELDAGAGGNATYQHFERGVVCYDPAHKVDHPPGAGDVYMLQLYNGGIGEDPRLKQIQTEYAALQQKYNTLLSGQTQAAMPTASAMKNRQIITQIKQLADQFVTN